MNKIKYIIKCKDYNSFFKKVLKSDRSIELELTNDEVIKLIMKLGRCEILPYTKNDYEERRILYFHNTYD